MHRCEWLRRKRLLPALPSAPALSAAGPTILNYGPINPFTREVETPRQTRMPKQKPFNWTEDDSDTHGPLLTIASLLLIGLVVLITIM